MKNGQIWLILGIIGLFLITSCAKKVRIEQEKKTKAIFTFGESRRNEK